VMSLYSRGRTHRRPPSEGHDGQQSPLLQPPTPVSNTQREDDYPRQTARGQIHRVDWAGGGGAPTLPEQIDVLEKPLSVVDTSLSSTTVMDQMQAQCSASGVNPCGCGEARVSPPSPLGRCDTELSPRNDRRRRSNRRASVNVTTPPGVAPGETVWGRARVLPGGASTRGSCRSGSTSPAQRAAEVGRAPQAMALAAGLSEGAHGNEGMSPNPLVSVGRSNGAATGGRLVNVTTPPGVALGGAAWDRARTLPGGASAKGRAHPEALHSQHGGRLEVGQAPQAAGRIRGGAREWRE